MDESLTYHINKALTYEGDDRDDPVPDDQKLDVFNQGWLKGVDTDKEDYGERAHSTLSWHNLGYRLGMLFGSASPKLREEMYYWCVEQMREE